MHSCKKIELENSEEKFAKTNRANTQDDQPLKSSINVRLLHQESGGI